MRRSLLAAVSFAALTLGACGGAVEDDPVPPLEAPAGAADDFTETRPAPDRDCSDFSSQAAAQAYYDSQTGDPDGLDRDGDGIACESL